MKVVIKRVGSYPEVAEIENDLDVFQKIVGGQIVCVSTIKNIVIVCNKEGRPYGDLELNMLFYGGPIYGDAFFCVKNGEDFGSLSDEDVEFLSISMWPIFTN